MGGQAGTLRRLRQQHEILLLNVSSLMVGLDLANGKDWRKLCVLSCHCDTTALYFWHPSMIIKFPIRESMMRVLGVWYLVEQSKHLPWSFGLFVNPIRW
jgi:hypothetical protein